MVVTKKIVFKSGFTYKGIPFGWYEDILCRLPYDNLNRYHSIKRVEFKSNTYRLGGCRKSKRQVDKMTEEINYTYTYYENKGCF